MPVHVPRGKSQKKKIQRVSKFYLFRKRQELIKAMVIFRSMEINQLSDGQITKIIKSQVAKERDFQGICWAEKKTHTYIATEGAEKNEGVSMFNLLKLTSKIINKTKSPSWLTLMVDGTKVDETALFTMALPRLCQYSWSMPQTGILRSLKVRSAWCKVLGGLGGG